LTPITGGRWTNCWLQLDWLEWWRQHTHSSFCWFMRLFTVHGAQLLVRSRFSASPQIPAVYETRCSLPRIQETATFSYPVFINMNVFHSH
jgi:hypothetical protein